MRQLKIIFKALTSEVFMPVDDLLDPTDPQNAYEEGVEWDTVQVCHGENTPLQFNGKSGNVAKRSKIVEKYQSTRAKGVQPLLSWCPLLTQEMQDTINEEAAARKCEVKDEPDIPYVAASPPYVMLLSDAGGVGLNLSAARVSMQNGCGFTATKTLQAMHRGDRVSQTSRIMLFLYVFSSSPCSLDPWKRSVHTHKLKTAVGAGVSSFLEGRPSGYHMDFSMPSDSAESSNKKKSKYLKSNVPKKKDGFTLVEFSHWFEHKLKPHLATEKAKKALSIMPPLEHIPVLPDTTLKRKSEGDVAVAHTDKKIRM